MPCDKKNQHPPKCVTRRLLETVAIKDLSQTHVCAPITKQFNGPGPSESGPCECEEDDCGLGGCCSSECDETSRSRRRKDVESLACEPECKVAELDAMMNEIASCRDFFRKLALETQDIIEPRNPQQDSCCVQDTHYERHAQDPQHERHAQHPQYECHTQHPQYECPAQNPQHEHHAQHPQHECSAQNPQHEHHAQHPQYECHTQHPQYECPAQNPQYERHAQKQNKLSGPGWCCKYTDMKDNRIEPNKRPKPMIHKCNSVGPKKQMYAPTTCSSFQDQSTSKLLTMPPTPPMSVSRNCFAPIAQIACKVKEGRLCKSVEEKLKNERTNERTDSKIGLEVTGGNTPEGKKKKNICKDLLEKVLGKRQSDCSCDPEMRKQTAETSPKEEIKQNKGKKPDCFCDETAVKGNKTVDCFCEEKAVKENKSVDCFCDEKAVKGNKPNDYLCDDEMVKQNEENERRKISIAVNQAHTTSKAETCPCCFPPAYNQYFNCTGQVSGNCHCDKSV